MGKTDDSILATTMAIREQLMEYFKGTCVERFTDGSNVFLRELGGSSRYQYQRENTMRTRPCELMLGDLPLLKVQKMPDKVIFYEKILTRSPQLQAVYQELQTFLDKYLGAIEVEKDQRGVIYAN